MVQYVLQTPVIRIEDAVFFDRQEAGHNPGRGSVNTGVIGNYTTLNGPPPGFPAPTYIRDIQVTSVSGNVLTCRGLDRFESFKAGVYEGGQIFVSRVVNNVMTEIGTYSVAAANVRSISTVTPDNQASETGSFRWSPPGYHRPSVTEYFAVAEIDANGDRSPWSTIVSFAVSSNPSQQSITNATASAPSYSKTENGALSAPSGVTVASEDGGLTAHVQWTVEAGKQYIVARSSFPEFDETQELILAEANPDVQVGDLVVIKNVMDHTKAKADVIANRIWGAGGSQRGFGVTQMAPFNEDLAEGSFSYLREADGTPFLRLDVAAGETLVMKHFTHTGTGSDGSYYPIVEADRTYNLDIRAKATGTGSVTARMNNVEGPKLVTLGSDYADVRTSFSTSTPPTGGSPMDTQLILNGPITVDIQKWFIADERAEPFMWRPEELDDLRRARPRFVRMHFAAKTRPFSYNARDFIASYGCASAGHGSYHRNLLALKQANDHDGATHPPASPWFHIPWHWSNDEHRLMSGYYYMASPDAGDTSPEADGARLRIALGQTEPWVDEFPEVMWECENENWNTISEFYTLPAVNGLTPGQVNGRMLDRLAEFTMAAPGYDAAKTKFYIGLWSVSSSWNAGSLESIHADFGGYSDYTNGWDVGVSVAGSLARPGDVQGMAANDYATDRKAKDERLVAECATASAGRAKPVLPMNYEIGPGYQLNGLNGAAVTPQEFRDQEAFSKGWVSGTASLGMFMRHAADGLSNPNFFTFRKGDGFRSHSADAYGGAASGAWQWFEFMNTNLVGEVVKLSSQNVNAYSSYGPADGNDVVAAYKVTTPQGVRYVLINYDSTSAHTVKLVMPIGASVLNPQIAKMTGDISTFNSTPATKDSIRIVVTAADHLLLDNQFATTLEAGAVNVLLLDPSP